MDGVFSVIVRTMSVQGDGRIALWKCGFVSTYQGWHIIRRRGQHWWFGQCHFQLGFGNKLLRLTRRGIFGDEFTMVTSSIFYGTTNIVLKDDGTIPRWQWISMSGSLLTKYNWNRQDRAWSNSKPDFRGFWHNFCLWVYFWIYVESSCVMLEESFFVLVRQLDQHIIARNHLCKSSWIPNNMSFVFFNCFHVWCL